MLNRAIFSSFRLALHWNTLLGFCSTCDFPLCYIFYDILYEQLETVSQQPEILPAFHFYNLISRHLWRPVRQPLTREKAQNLIGLN